MDNITIIDIVAGIGFIFLTRSLFFVSSPFTASNQISARFMFVFWVASILAMIF